MTWNLDQCFKSSAILAHSLGAKRWATVGPDYGFGQDSWKYFQKYLAELETYSFVKAELVPMATNDWKPVIKNVVGSGADAVMVSLWGNNLRDFLRQAHEEQFFVNRKVLCPVGGSVEIFFALGFIDMPQGVWFGTPYWYEAYDNQFNNKFVEVYKSLSASEIPPSYAAYNSYAAVKMIKGAVEKAGSSERADIAKALSGLTVTDLPVGPTNFRAEDHQAIYDVTFGATGGRVAKGSKRMRGLDPIKKFPGWEVTPPGFRDRLQHAPIEMSELPVHDYFAVDLDEVWVAAERDIPQSEKEESWKSSIESNRSRAPKLTELSNGPADSDVVPPRPQRI